MLTVFFRAIILYGFSVFAIRLMGKRQIGQLQPYELVAAILIADLVAEPMSGAEIPLLYGIVPVAALLLMHSLFSLLGMKSPAVRRFLNGSARVLVQDGSIRYTELKRVCMPLSDLLELIRAAGVASITEVGAAVLETNGVLSVFPRAQDRPPTMAEWGMRPPEDQLPHVLISDGVRRDRELAAAGLTGEQLDHFLKRRGVAEEKQVLLCVLDSDHTVFLQRRGDRQPAQRVRVKEGLQCEDA